LFREAEALRSDTRAVENVARADLGWVKPGEVVFDLGRNP
jgi:cell division protein FtsB